MLLLTFLFIYSIAALNLLWKVHILCVIFRCAQRTTVTEILVFAGSFWNFQLSFHKNVYILVAVWLFHQFHSKNNDKSKVWGHYFFKRWRKTNALKAWTKTIKTTVCYHNLVYIQSFHLVVTGHSIRNMTIWRKFQLDLVPVASALKSFLYFRHPSILERMRSTGKLPLINRIQYTSLFFFFFPTTTWKHQHRMHTRRQTVLKIYA